MKELLFAGEYIRVRANIMSLSAIGCAFAISLGIIATAGLAATAEPQSPGPTLRIPLDWQESSEPFVAYNLRFSSEKWSFLQEPDFGRHRVVRGAFNCGILTNEFVPFAWDQTANRLYLDRNGNRDLTDDTEAVYTGEYDGFQLFPRVKLDLKTRTGSRRYLVDLRLGGTTPPQLQGTCILRSYWQGRVDLGGRADQIGLVENPEARTAKEEARYLVFRPWDAREKPLRLNPGTPNLINWSPRVFLAGEDYTLSYQYTNEIEAFRYVLDLTPTQPPLGELRAQGQFLYRLILYQPTGYTVVLDQPGPSEKLPLGTYQHAEVWLRQNSVEAFYIGPLRLTIAANTPVSISMGGPLTNCVTAERDGENLVLRYQLTGTGNPAPVYRLSQEDRSQPPGWTIFAGEKTVASGKFEYG